MKRLDRFILKAFLGPFMAILLVVIFILVMQFLWLYIDELVGKGLGIKIILEFMMWGGCTILPLALPLATLLASMMTIGQMAENNELMAIKASGVSLLRVITPLSIASALIAIGAFFSGNNLVPKAYNEIYTLRDDIGRTKEEIKIPPGTFYDGIDGYILRVEEYDKNNGMMRNVMVYDHSVGKGNTSVTLADSAVMKMSDSKLYLTFTLFHGSNYQETNKRDYKDTCLEVQHINFARQELLVPLTNYAFEKSDSSRFGDQVASMKVSQLKHRSDSLHVLADSAHVKHIGQMRTVRNFRYASQLDTAEKKRPTIPFEDKDLLKWSGASDELNAIKSARGVVDHFSSMLANDKRDIYEYQFYLHRMDLEYLRKFAQALACFILFFIGAPLGALIKKGGLGSSAIVSVLFFVLYWVVDITGAKLAKNGDVGAVTGAFCSSFVLGSIGIFLTWKAINDSPLWKGDSFKARFKQLTSMIERFFHPTRIVYMGTPEFAVEPLDRLIKSGYKVVGVVTVADKPSGRGLKVNESAVKKYAVEHNLPLLQPLDLKDPEFLGSLKAWKADMFVVVAFRMLPEVVWQMPRLGTFNLHAALLPQYRGAAPINWAVINGERMTGVTSFMIDKSMDTGGILIRQEYRIEPEDNAGDVHDALMMLGADVVVQTVEGLIQHNLEMRVQRSFIQGSEVLKTAPKITRETCTIDWNKPTREIHNLIRGLSPYPAAFTTICKDGGEPLQLKIFRSEAVDLHAEPGTILSDGKTYLAIATSDGALSLKDIQLSGKKRMAADDFLLGFREPQSYKTV